MSSGSYPTKRAARGRAKTNSASRNITRAQRPMHLHPTQWRRISEQAATLCYLHPCQRCLRLPEHLPWRRRIYHVPSNVGRGQCLLRLGDGRTGAYQSGKDTGERHQPEHQGRAPIVGRIHRGRTNKTEGRPRELLRLNGNQSKPEYMDGIVLPCAVRS